MLQLHAWFHYPSELLVSARAPLLDSNICKQHKRSVVKNMRLQTSNSVCGMKMVVPWDFHTIRFQTSQIGGFHGIKVAGQDPIMMVFSFGRRIWREITCGIMSGMIYNLCLVLYQPIFFCDWRFISEEFHDLKKWSWTYTWDWSHVGHKGYRFLKTQTVSFLCDPKSEPFLPGSRFEKSVNLEWRITK